MKKLGGYFVFEKTIFDEKLRGNFREFQEFCVNLQRKRIIKTYV
jgi:hypothetical protein